MRRGATTGIEFGATCRRALTAELWSPGCARSVRATAALATAAQSFSRTAAAQPASVAKPAAAVASPLPAASAPLSAPSA